MGARGGFEDRGVGRKDRLAAPEPGLRTSFSPRGTTSTLELYDQPTNLEDGQAHTLLWTRTASGVMVVSLDGKELFRATDRSFSDPFDGFAVVNSGGDYALKSITIDGPG